MKLYWFYSTIEKDRKYVRIIDENYEDKWEAVISEKEFKLFMKIMNNNKHALLHRRHNVFEKVSNIKLRYGKTIERKQ